MTNSTTYLDTLSKELGESLSIEDFIFNGFGTIDSKIA